MSSLVKSQDILALVMYLRKNNNYKDEQMTQHILLTGGTGLLGKQLIQDNSTARITNISRQKSMGITWDQLENLDLSTITHVVHLAGENIARQRWSTSFKEKLYTSRADTLNQLSLVLKKAPKLEQVIIASGSSVYGLYKSDHSTWTESKTLANDNHFFCQLARRLEENATSLALPNITFLRLGVVLSPFGGALPKLALPFRFKIGLKLNKKSIPLSWIALSDTSAAIRYIIDHKLYGPINCVAPQHTHFGDLYSVLKTHYRPLFSLKLPKIFSWPLGEMAQSTIHLGQHSYPERLLEAGFKFQYPVLSTRVVS
ncbi:MAG: DUF1731 domain-containing protein [Candidatus Comchoanobacterales bacterium]